MPRNGEEMIVTPWEVAGKIDYEKLIRDFGTQPLTPELLERIRWRRTPPATREANLLLSQGFSLASRKV
jgi:tryptophanyl-tRNA synthetase